MAQPTPFVEMIDIHGRVCDPVTGNPLGDGQEGPGSIFHVPSKDEPRDYVVFTDQGKKPWSDVMKTLVNSGFQGGHIMMHSTPRPEDVDRPPSPPPSLTSHQESGGFQVSTGNIYRTQCAYCWAILQGKERERGFKLCEIQQAAAKGCGACDVLCNAVVAFGDIIFASHDNRKVRIRQKGEGITRLLSESKQVTVCFDEHDAEVMKLSIKGTRKLKPHEIGTPWDPNYGLDDREKISRLAGSRVQDTSSYATVLLVKRWLETCSSEHSSCAIPAATIVPRRVLEVSNYRARLIETDGRMIAPYLTLSHCWGKDPIIRLLKDNLDAMKRDIPWPALSKTFQDAIFLTWRLGFRYIWIDSLCILQDSKDDWEYHAASMAKIYTNSQLTISASAGQDGAHGCFTSRLHEPYVFNSTRKPVYDTKLWLPLEVDGRDRDGCVKTFSITLMPSHGLYGNRRPKEPLLNRAWVFQEQILSPRIVHFASGELYFECKSHLTCECEGSTWSRRSESYQWETRWRKAHNVLLNGEEAANVPPEHFDGNKRLRKQIFEFEAYRALVETYTELAITKEQDKLPALSGVTFGRKDQYLAGLWKELLVESLHWYPTSKSLRGIMAHRPFDYRAPSWSWASMEAPIKHIDKDFHKTPNSAKCNVEIVDASTTLAGVDPRGRVTDGHLRVRGLITEARVTAIGVCEREGDQVEKFSKNSAEISPGHVDRSLTSYRDLGTELATYVMLQWDEGDVEDRAYLDVPLVLSRSSPAEVIVGEQVLCLMISTSTLMVLKAIDDDFTEFVRVGLFRPKSKGWGFVKTPESGIIIR